MLWVLKKNHLKHMYKLMDKKIIIILCSKILPNWPYVNVNNNGEGQPWNFFGNPGVIHSVPTAFVITEWVTPGLPRIS